MNKVIIPAVIIVGVVTIILSGFGWNMNTNIDGVEPLEPLHVEGTTRDNGEIVCPDGKTKETSRMSAYLGFSEDMLGNKGMFSINTQGSSLQRSLSAQLYNGNVASSDYQVYGVAQISVALANQCGLDDSPYFMEITVWGLCGEGVTINFETNNGFKGSSVGTVFCI